MPCPSKLLGQQPWCLYDRHLYFTDVAREAAQAMSHGMDTVIVGSGKWFVVAPGRGCQAVGHFGEVRVGGMVAENTVMLGILHGIPVDNDMVLCIQGYRHVCGGLDGKIGRMVGQTGDKGIDVGLQIAEMRTK